MRLEALSSTPGAMPNGLQWTDEGLFVIDQLTDDVHVLDEAGRVLREMTTLTENGSGITVGGGYLWTGSNGATRARPYRETDTHEPWILKLDIDTGELVERYPTPDGGGVHGIEWDDGLLWVTSFTSEGPDARGPRRLLGGQEAADGPRRAARPRPGRGGHLVRRPR